MKLLLALTFLISPLAQAADYQDGDIIFHESRSAQSKAIQEATESRWSHVGIIFQERGKWQVAEAVQPVRVVSLSSFIARGKNKEYRIYRLPTLTGDQKKDLRQQVDKLMGQNYDIYFEWTDDLIYCSELVYKTFLKATGVEIGEVQKYRELKLEGPFVKELIKRRLIDTGRTLNLDESIVTPDSQVQDSDLILVEKSK